MHLSSRSLVRINLPACLSMRVSLNLAGMLRRPFASMAWINLPRNMEVWVLLPLPPVLSIEPLYPTLPHKTPQVYTTKIRCQAEKKRGSKGEAGQWLLHGGGPSFLGSPRHQMV